MRWTHFLLLQCLLIILVGSIVYLHRDYVILIKKPPASLGQWYKPHSERQVWLHNMFKLRREMQAVGLYAEQGDAERLNSWVARLGEHYLKMAEMVPEWGDRLERELITSLQQSAAAGRYQEIRPLLDRLERSCESCHSDYRAATAAIYRTADFSSIRIESSHPFGEYMEQLSRQVNRISIASQDGMPDIALFSLDELEKGITRLGETCSGCHSHDKRIYPDPEMEKSLATLRHSLQNGTPRQQGRDLGALAVQACARCHGTHRIVYDAGRLLSEQRSWLELLRH